MKRKSVYTCLVMLLMSLVLQAKDKDVAVAEALLKRLLPSYIESFQFQKLKGEKDCFTIESVKDKIVDRKSTRLNSSHSGESRMPSSA